MTYPGILIMIVPPAAGAVIGYLTNAIAIRMLFRPLKAYHIGRIRLPFTPGIIPRQRERLAESIATMVGQTLLTPETLLGHLRQPEMRMAIESYVSRITGSIADVYLNEQHNSDTPEAGGKGALIQRIIEDVLLSPVFSDLLSLVIRQIHAATLDLKIGSLIPGKSSEAIVDQVYRNLKRRDTQVYLRRNMKKIVSLLRNIDQPVRNFIPEEFTADVLQILNDQYDPVWERIINWLKKDEIQKELSSRGRVLLQRILKRLGSFQRFFVSAGQYDRSLDEQMPRIISDLIQQLEYSISLPETRRLILLEARILIEECISCTPESLEKKLSIDLARALDAWMEKAFGALDNPTADSSVRKVSEQMYAAVHEIRVSDLLHSWFSLNPEMISSMMNDKVRRYLGISGDNDLERREQVSRRLEQWKAALIRRITHTRQIDGELIKPEQRQKLDAYLTDTFYRIMENKLPDLVSSVDVQSLVKNKVNSLDMLQVEQLLLMVMQKHLKYINIFGAFLGALIGAGQVILLQFI